MDEAEEAFQAVKRRQDELRELHKHPYLSALINDIRLVIEEHEVKIAKLEQKDMKY